MTGFFCLLLKFICTRKQTRKNMYISTNEDDDELRKTSNIKKCWRITIDEKYNVSDILESSRVVHFFGRAYLNDVRRKWDGCTWNSLYYNKGYISLDWTARVLLIISRHTVLENRVYSLHYYWGLLMERTDASRTVYRWQAAVRITFFFLFSISSHKEKQSDSGNVW